MKVLAGLSSIFFIYFVVVMLSSSTAYAEVSASIEANGADSNNYIGVTQTNSSSVNQTNTGIISNIINIFSNTGDNSSSNNTGTNTSTQTGNASAGVNINNNLNSNYTQVDDCCVEVPEFGLIPGVLAALTSGGTFLYIKKKTWAK